MNQPLVTVLMPCYNAMPYLSEAIESIMNQTYQNLEILCINDGSTDETGSVLEKYASQDKRVRVVHNEKNIRLIATLNKGIELANGKYIARMDADDISSLDRIENMITFFQNNADVDVLCPGSINITESGNYINKNVIRVKTAKGMFFGSFLFSAYGHAETILKTEILKENNYLEGEKVLHTEDYELYTKLMHKGYQLYTMDQVLYSVRINSQSVSRKYTDIQDANFIYQANQFYNAYTNKKISLTISKVIANRIDHTISINDFFRGINELKWFKKIFTQREKVNNDEQKEINVVYNTHLFDICIQGLKRGKWSLKIISFPMSMWYTLICLCQSTTRKYILNKW